jgi:serine/threonine protein kinase
VSAAGGSVVCLECAAPDEFARWRRAFEQAAAAGFDAFYKRLGVIGRGHFSTVFLAVDRRTGEKFAVKVIKKDAKEAEKSRKFIRREVKVLSVTSHENLVGALDFFSHRGKPHIVLEYMPHGSLKDLIVRKTRLEEGEARRIFRGILSGMAYLHAHKIVHRDMKPENVLLGGTPDAPVAKLTDFGLSTFLSDGHKIYSTVGTPSYVSPELCAGVPYGTPADMWSCGVVLFFMLSGDRPFEGDTRSEMKACILRGRVTFPEEGFRRVGQNARRLVLRLLDMDQATRITAGQALVHPWLAQTEGEPAG